ncbi:MAG: cytochrome c-type biogenesis CcmF C-terminal domain-containing protein, partial [Arenimonas sp.]|uniref:molybdate ABC transporter substrate-binding protein n=1 Tax=Arenimonas sp. TaxID=1872635 RepID=UPI003BFEB771
GVLVGVWVVFGVGMDVVRRVGPGGFGRVFRLPLTVWGMASAHIGVGIFVIGATVETATRSERTFPLRPGEIAEMAGWTFQFQNLEQVEGPNYSALRANILAASIIVCPDPATATAGKIVMKLMERLGVASQVEDRMQFYPNGNAAMNWLAASNGNFELGITQNTEILPIKGVTFVGPLPDEFQMKTVYTAGIAVRGAQPELARDFIRRLTAPEFQPQLRAAGYEID